MAADRPLGPPRIVQPIQERALRPLRGAAVFATAGTVVATMVAMNPMLGRRKQMADVVARAARSGLPQVVVLAVDDDGVDVYPSTSSGQIVDDAVARWAKGTFSATTFRRLLVVQLAVTLRDGQRLTFETKSFPVGVNRRNAAVARMILAMATAP